MASTQIQAWLTTMHAAEGSEKHEETVFPDVGSGQPLMRSFNNKGPGSSAAPIEVGATLAEGGMGVVKFAKQKALGRTVVVKTMRGDFEQSAAEDILREAWATGALEHPNIVPVHDVRVGADGAPVIVLKRIEGDTWSKLMRDDDLVRERFGVRDVLDWHLNVLSQVCQAVRYAHSRHILHRDLKPDNVMVGSFGEVYLVDWGIALSLSESLADCPLALASEQSAVAGTPCYMAPEMLGGAPLDARTDIYLLGGLLFEVLAKRPPHRTSNLADLMADIEMSKPEIPETAPALLADLVRKAMAADPDKRFATASKLAEALQLFQQTRGSQLLAKEAEERMQELQGLLLSSDSPAQDVHRVFGAVRFGFETAIEAWGDNLIAIEMLNEARADMAEFELSRGNAQAAHAHYQALTEGPKELGERITAAIAKRDTEQEELTRFRDDSDLLMGLRTRVVLILALGSVWTILPLVVHLIPEHLPTMNYRTLLVSTFAMALLAIGGWFWARESMMKTNLNRRLSSAILALFPTQLVLFIGAAMMGLPSVQAELLMMFLWVVLISAVVATIDTRFFFLAVVDAGMFLLAVRYPEQRYLLMSVANGVLVVNALYIWSGQQEATAP